MSSQPVERERLHYLDSIRGVAACIVMVYHFIGWKWSETLQFKIARFAFNGTEAVSFFFVLSGFVLSYSYINSDRKIKFGRYLYKRILRLYPAYVLNVFLLFLYNIRHQFTIDTFKSVFVLNERPQLWKEFLMFTNTHDLYFAGWTLQVEIIYSLVIVLLIIIYRLNKHLLWGVLIGSYFIGDPNLRIYMTHFILGVAVAMIYPKIKTLPFSQTKLYPWRWVIYFTIFVLFSFINLAKFVPFISDAFNFFWAYNIRWAHFSGLAAFMILILVIMSKPAQNFLNKGPLLYLGKISYSIYLIHWLVVIVIMDYWATWSGFLGDGALLFGVMFVVFIATTLLLADLMYRFVEAPFIRLSKRSFLKGLLFNRPS